MQLRMALDDVRVQSHPLPDRSPRLYKLGAATIHTKWNSYLFLPRPRWNFRTAIFGGRLSWLALPGPAPRLADVRRITVEE